MDGRICERTRSDCNTVDQLGRHSQPASSLAVRQLGFFYVLLQSLLGSAQISPSPTNNGQQTYRGPWPGSRDIRSDHDDKHFMIRPPSNLQLRCTRGDRYCLPDCIMIEHLCSSMMRARHICFELRLRRAKMQLSRMGHGM